MLGMGDFSIFAVYSLCILSAILCIAYGILNWNKGQDATKKELEKEIEWEQEELEITQTLDV